MMYDCSSINAILTHYNSDRHNQFKIQISVIDEKSGKDIRVMIPTCVDKIEEMLVDFHAGQKNDIRAQINMLQKKLDKLEHL